MLEKLRDRHQNKTLQYLIYAMLGGITVVFAVSFGPGSFGQAQGPGPTMAATVNGEGITAADLNVAYNNTLDRQRQLMGQAIDPEQARAMGLRARVLDSLIERRLLGQAALAHGVQVPDSEVIDQIRDIPVFQIEGRFDPETYSLYVKNALGKSPRRFEEELRLDLVEQRMRELVRELAHLSDGELFERFQNQRDQINLEFVRISPIPFRAVANPSPEQIEAKRAGATAEIAEWYERNKFRYETPKRVRARHILIKAEADAPAADRDAAKARLEGLIAQLEGGADFAALASEHSEDVGSKEKGGDLGMFGAGSMVKPFEEAAFALQAGERSGIVETRFGFHVIQVEEVQEAKTRSLEEVEGEIAEILVKEGAADAAAKARAEEVLKVAQGAESLASLYPPEAPVAPGTPAPPADPMALHAAETGLTAISTGFIPGMGRDAEVAARLLALPDGTSLIGEVIEINGTYFVARVIERERASRELFESERDSFRKSAEAQKKAEVERAWVEALREKATIEINQAVVDA